jgi:hypothetical protein
VSLDAIATDHFRDWPHRSLCQRARFAMEIRHPRLVPSRRCSLLGLKMSAPSERVEGASVRVALQLSATALGPQIPRLIMSTSHAPISGVDAGRKSLLGGDLLKKLAELFTFGSGQRDAQRFYVLSTDAAYLAEHPLAFLGQMQCILSAIIGIRPAFDQPSFLERVEYRHQTTGMDAESRRQILLSPPETSTMRRIPASGGVRLRREIRSPNRMAACAPTWASRKANGAFVFCMNI